MHWQNKHNEAHMDYRRDSKVDKITTLTRVHDHGTLHWTKHTSQAFARIFWVSGCLTSKVLCYNNCAFDMVRTQASKTLVHITRTWRNNWIVFLRGCRASTTKITVRVGRNRRHFDQFRLPNAFNPIQQWSPVSCRAFVHEGLNIRNQDLTMRKFVNWQQVEYYQFCLCRCELGDHSCWKQFPNGRRALRTCHRRNCDGWGRCGAY